MSNPFSLPLHGRWHILDRPEFSGGDFGIGESGGVIRRFWTNRISSFAAALAILFLATPVDAPARQFEAPPDEKAGAGSAEPAEKSEPLPTIDSIVAAVKAGRPAGEIVSWIERSGVRFNLDYEEALRLSGDGVPSTIIASLAGVAPTPASTLLGDGPRPSGKPRLEGLKKRQILKAIKAGTPEEQLLAELSSTGSQASLSLKEAVELHAAGSSPALIRAIVTATPRSPGGQPAPPVGAEVTAPQPPAEGDEEVPEADDLLGEETGGTPEIPGEEAPSLDDLLGNEPDEEGDPGEEPEFVIPEDEEIEAAPEEETGEGEAGDELVAPLLDDALGPAPEPDTRTTILSTSEGSRVFTAPGGVRISDLLRHMRPAGQSPAVLSIAPGFYQIIVEKKLDAFDEETIPALKTLHDGDGRTRTLIVSGDIYYESRRCCLPRSVSGDLRISRIGEDQERAVLGDQYQGLPPYMWDGNRYLLLSIKEGRIRRVLKVYEMRKGAGEARTLTATFVPSHVDPLAAPPAPAAGEEPVEAPEIAEARATWTSPSAKELSAIGRVAGIPKDDLARIAERLPESGKATWRKLAADGSLVILTLSLDTDGRLRTSEMRLKRDGPGGYWSAPLPPPPAKKKKPAKAPPVPPAPLEIVREIDPEAGVPLLRIENGAAMAAFVRLGDGMTIVVMAGEQVEIEVTPGTVEVEALFEDRPSERRTGRAFFTKRARYTLKLG